MTDQGLFGNDTFFIRCAALSETKYASYSEDFDRRATGQGRILEAWWLKKKDEA